MNGDELYFCANICPSVGLVDHLLIFFFFFSFLRSLHTVFPVDALYIPLYWGILSKHTHTSQTHIRKYDSFLLKYSWCMGFPGGSNGKEPACNGRPRLLPWIREWLPTPISLPGKFHGERSLVQYSPWGCKESDTLLYLMYNILYELQVYYTVIHNFKGCTPFIIFIKYWLFYSCCE